METMTKTILDPCCGGRMFWFDKENPHVLFCDNRTLEEVVGIGRNARRLSVNPDITSCFTDLPFPDESFIMLFSTLPT
jgi:hypothetical protein